MALRIYVGANNKALGISKYQHFTSEGASSDVWPGYAPQHIRDALIKSPGISNYFIDFDRYMAERKSTAYPTTAPSRPVISTEPPIKAPDGISRSRIR